jgi:hypothetical protein
MPQTINGKEGDLQRTPPAAPGFKSLLPSTIYPSLYSKLKVLEFLVYGF